jgi:large subunit ribosomal protein L9
MEVILREHVEHLGERGEVVKVAAGYARNFLLPRKLALLVTAGNKKQIERERAKFEAREAEEKKVITAEAEKLAGTEVVIARRVGDTQALYGSVTTADIAEALAAKGFDIDKRKLVLADPLKSIGDVDVPVKLHREITVNIKVRVVAEGAASA